MTDSVEVFLRGGLGNQLFQYAAGFSLSKKLGLDLVLRTDYLPLSSKMEGQVRTWPEQISSFEHEGSIKPRPIRSGATLWINSRFGQLARKLGDCDPRIPQTFRMFAYESEANVSEFMKIRKPIRLNGYFADSIYFENHADTISASIRAIRNPSDWFSSTSKTIMEQRPIALHVRLGDYENLTNIYGGTRLDFIRRALSLQRERFPHSPTWVFTDDQDRAQSLLGKHVNFDYVVKTPKDSRPLESLLLLSQSRAMVCTNSTFSWWAAFLGHRVSRNVIFPRPLYPSGSIEEPKDWLMPDWVQVGGY